MTLPGIAGIILTIGVAADANIVIFERIKEEVRAGKSVRAAIATGYSKGFATIVDANVVTMITAGVLFMVATGGVRGFALMLLLGTLISMFTAVLATRALLGVLSRFRWFDNPRFMGASAEKIPDWQKIDIVGLRRIWFTTATVILVISVAAIIFKGLNLGIDFEGGTQVSFQTAEPTAVEDVRDEMAAIGRAGRRHPGPRRRDERRVHAVPDQDRVAARRPSRTSSRAPSRTTWAPSRSASATSPEASASRSCAAPSTRSSRRSSSSSST